MVRWKTFGVDSKPLVEAVKLIAHPMETSEDLDRSIDQTGDQMVGMLGEATHGTSEFYPWRAGLSQRLIREKGYCFLAVEGDWPDCYRLNRYVKGYPTPGESAFRVLTEFNCCPSWMWANWEDVLHNADQGCFYLLLREKREDERFSAERGRCAIAVVDNPEFERYGSDAPTRLPMRYDAFMFIDKTQALHPMHLQQEREPAVPKTYSWGL